MQKSVKEIKRDWNRAPDSINKFHRNSCSCNVKYLSPDGHYEVVINTRIDMIVTDPRDVGTYNYVSVPIKKPKLTNVLGTAKYYSLMGGHLVVDVIPYSLFGNSDQDFASLSDRIIGH